MEWTDDAIVLSTRPHGESAVVASLLTRSRGRHAGLVRGGAAPRGRGVVSPGNRVRAHWRGRLAEHLGVFTCEPLEALSPAVLEDGDRLAALVSACALLDGALPEREPTPDVYDDLAALLTLLALRDNWFGDYVRWEVAVLAALGFALDLSRCAGGGNDQLAYVSPRTGRAVSLSAGEPYRDKLLALPRFLLEPRMPAGRTEAVDGLRLTGYFFERFVFADVRAGQPAARRRLVERLDRSAAPLAED